MSGKAIDFNFMDFEKLNNFKYASLCYKIFGKEFKYDEFSQKESNEEFKNMSGEEWNKFNTLRNGFQRNRHVSFGPLCALVGGIVA